MLTAFAATPGADVHKSGAGLVRGRAAVRYLATSPVADSGSPAAPPIGVRSPLAPTRKPLIVPSPELSEWRKRLLWLSAMSIGPGPVIAVRPSASSRMSSPS